MAYPSNYLYTKEHEWVLIEGEIATIGITEFAQSQLGELVFIDLPNVGAEFNINDPAGALESVKSVSEFFVPCTGTVTEINKELNNAPELANDDPHGEGWLIKMQHSNKADFDFLMDAAAYEEYLESPDSH